MKGPDLVTKDDNEVFVFLSERVATYELGKWICSGQIPKLSDYRPKFGRHEIPEKSC